MLSIAKYCISIANWCDHMSVREGKHNTDTTHTVKPSYTPLVELYVVYVVFVAFRITVQSE